VAPRGTWRERDGGRELSTNVAKRERACKREGGGSLFPKGDEKGFGKPKEILRKVDCNPLRGKKVGPERKLPWAESKDLRVRRSGRGAGRETDIVCI